MSKVVTPSSLKWLINKRARLLGEINKLEKSLPDRISKARQDVECAEANLAQAKERLASEDAVVSRIIPAIQADLQAIDAAMSLHEIQINPEIIPPIRTQDASRALPYGEITRSIYDCLKCSGGCSVTTTEITIFIAAHNNLELSDMEFQTFRTAVRYRLKDIAAQGKIERLHQGKGSIEGKWRLPRDAMQPIPAWKAKVTRPRA